MATYILQMGHLVRGTMGDHHGEGLAMFRQPFSIRPPIRPPPVRPGGAGRPGGGGAGAGRTGGTVAGRPGRVRGGGGSWSSKALAVAVGAGLAELWSFKWYILGGFGAYITLRMVKRFLQRNANANSATLLGFSTVSTNATALLGAYVREVLQRESLADLDVCTITTSSVSETKGLSVGCYCVEHLHLKIIYPATCGVVAESLMDGLDSAFNSLRNMLVLNARMGYRLSENIDGSKCCMLSKNGQTIGIFVMHNSSDFGCWDCCSSNMRDAVVVAKRYENLTYMAARRLSNETTLLFDTISDGPEFVTIACDGVCNLMDNLNAVSFVYQAARAEMELRPLCDVLLDGLLSSRSSATMVAVFVQFKAPHLGEGCSVDA